MADDEGDALQKRERAKRQWTFETASRILPDVRRLTERARASYNPLRERREGFAKGSVERVEAEQGMRRCLSQWVREMEALGVRVRGLWRVEFSSEGGAFPWHWPQEAIRTLHDEGEETTIH